MPWLACKELALFKPWQMVFLRLLRSVCKFMLTNKNTKACSCVHKSALQRFDPSKAVCEELLHVLLEEKERKNGKGNG